MGKPLLKKKSNRIKPNGTFYARKKWKLAALIGRKELKDIMDKLITGCQYCIKHQVRGVLISTCFLKLKQVLYQNFMEDLIHSPGF